MGHTSDLSDGDAGCEHGWCGDSGWGMTPSQLLTATALGGTVPVPKPACWGSWRLRRAGGSRAACIVVPCASSLSSVVGIVCCVHPELPGPVPGVLMGLTQMTPLPWHGWMVLLPSAHRCTRGHASACAPISAPHLGRRPRARLSPHSFALVQPVHPQVGRGRLAHPGRGVTWRGILPL